VAAWISIKYVPPQLHRDALTERGAVSVGTVVGAQVVGCFWLGCENQRSFNGEPGSGGYYVFKGDWCPRRGKCWHWVDVEFDHGGRSFLIKGHVTGVDHEEIRIGDDLAVLVNPEQPQISILRDHNPHAFMHWLALGLSGLVALAYATVASALISARKKRISGDYGRPGRYGG